MNDTSTSYDDTQVHFLDASALTFAAIRNMVLGFNKAFALSGHILWCYDLDPTVLASTSRISYSAKGNMEGNKTMPNLVSTSYPI